MLLSTLSAILVIVFGIGAKRSYDNDRDISSAICVVFLAIWLFIFITFSLVGIVVTCTNDGSELGAAQLHDSLVYQLENDIYDNDNDLGKKELYDQITEWNHKVVSHSKMNDSIWFGMVYYDY